SYQKWKHTFAYCLRKLLMRVILILVKYRRTLVVSERDKALDEALRKIEKQFGKGSIMKLGEGAQRKLDTISSGSEGIDIALVIVGYAKGRIIEIYGPESSGKATVALHASAQAQKAGVEATFIDAEHAHDPKYAKALGVDSDEILLYQPDTG